MDLRGEDLAWLTGA